MDTAEDFRHSVVLNELDAVERVAAKSRASVAHARARLYARGRDADVRLGKFLLGVLRELADATLVAATRIMAADPSVKGAASLRSIGIKLNGSRVLTHASLLIPNLEDRIAECDEATRSLRAAYAHRFADHHTTGLRFRPSNRRCNGRRPVSFST